MKLLLSFTCAKFLFNRGIYVLDDLFTASELKQFRDILLKSGGPRVSLFDGSALEDNDNVQWIDAYEVSQFSSGEGTIYCRSTSEA